VKLEEKAGKEGTIAGNLSAGEDSLLVCLPWKKGYITVSPKHKGPRGKDEETKEKN
jgi:hypothetical protein